MLAVCPGNLLMRSVVNIVLRMLRANLSNTPSGESILHDHSKHLSHSRFGVDRQVCDGLPKLLIV